MGGDHVRGFLEGYWVNSLFKQYLGSLKPFSRVVPSLSRGESV